MHDTHQYHFEERAVLAGCGVMGVGANETNASVHNVKTRAIDVIVAGVAIHPSMHT